MTPIRIDGPADPRIAEYHNVSDAALLRPRGLFVLTLDGDQISAITWFADTSVFPQFGLPRTMR